MARGRPKGSKDILPLRKELDDRARMKIKAASLLNLLIDHALGKKEMKMTQIRAAEILLRKVIPDLKSVEHTGKIVHQHSRDELLMKADQLGIPIDLNPMH